jgi:predicted  nucleic acid-binding Zn-ribbon protein
LLSLVALAAAVPAPAEDVDLGALKEALRTLTGEARQRQHSWSNTAEGQARWSELERTIGQATSAAARIETLAAQIESAEHKVASRKRDMESRSAEVERVKRLFEQQREEFARRYEELEREFDELIARKDSVPDDQAAIDAWNEQLAYLERKQKLYNADLKQVTQEINAMIDAANSAWIAAQREYQDAVVQHGELLGQLNEAVIDFQNAQQAAITTMAASTTGQFTGFSPGFGSPHQTRDTARDPLRELRIIARKSERGAAAGTLEGASDISGQKVDTITGDDEEAVPLEFEDGAVAVESGAKTTGETGKAPPAAHRQSAQQRDNLARLDQLYQLRNKIVGNPAAYAPDALTHVINDITSTHSAIVTTAYETKVAQEGSKKRSLVVNHDDAEEPSPPPPPPPTP